MASPNMHRRVTITAGAYSGDTDRAEANTLPTITDGSDFTAGAVRLASCPTGKLYIWGELRTSLANAATQVATSAMTWSGRVLCHFREEGEDVVVPRVSYEDIAGKTMMLELDIPSECNCWVEVSEVAAAGSAGALWVYTSAVGR